jgi:hypothetical protein
MEKEMRELYIEGFASHGGPESCVGVCEGDGEALTGVVAGWAGEPRNQEVRGFDAVKQAGRHHRLRRYARAVRGPRAVGEPVDVAENLCMYGISKCENREIPRSPAGVMAGRAAQGTLRR